MAEEAPTTTAQVTPVSAPTPVVEAVSAPVAVASVTPAPETAPAASTVATPVEAIEVAPTTETPAPEAPKTPETVLGSEPVAEAPKAEGETEVKTDEGGQTEQAPPPKYDQWTLPDNIKLDETRVGEFTNLLSELETTGKASHEAVQAFGQKAVEFHINEVKNAVQRITDIYKEAWDKQKTDWKETFLKDPEIGGNKFQTTVDAANTFIRTHGGTSEQQQEFRNIMESSGLGNHPTMIRLLANAGVAMSEGKPLAAPKPISQPKSKTQTLYGK